MDIKVRADNININPVMEEHILKKLNRLTRYLPNIADVYVEFTRQRSRHGDDQTIAQITVRHMRGTILRAEEAVEGENIEAALTKALDNMYRRIERFKGKQTRKGKTRFSLSLEELDLAEESPHEEPASQALATATNPQPEEIIRRKTVDLVTMNEEEAVEQLELLGHTFFMFFNEGTMSVNVLYKRKDGGYGILVPNLV